jgi:hypothetical protein
VKRHRHTPEQAVRKLREGERLLGEGADLAGVLRHLEIAESMWNRWRGQYGGMKLRTVPGRGAAIGRASHPPRRRGVTAVPGKEEITA